MKFKRHRLIPLVVALVVALTIHITVLATDFNQSISITGGSAQQLSAVLTGAGYSGPPDQVQWITICVPSTNANTLYLGGSNVSAANGFPLKPGQCNTLPPSSVPIKTSSIYLFVTSTETESFQAHGN
jgi:hypothetical protein